MGVLLDLLLDHPFYRHQGPAAGAPLRHLRPTVYTHRNSDVLMPNVRQVTTWFINQPQPSLRNETLSTTLTSFMKRFQPRVIKRLCIASCLPSSASFAKLLQPPSRPGLDVRPSDAEAMLASTSSPRIRANRRCCQSSRANRFH